jgi:WhiB family redox-sensing transcriptional regulator
MNEKWFDKAVCKGMDRKIFFPKNPAGLKKAKEICSRCPVSSDCLNFAVQESIAFGVWGGTSERERIRKLIPMANKVKRQEQVLESV